MVTSAIVRAIGLMRRLPASRPQLYGKPALDRIHRSTSSSLARRCAGLHAASHSGGGDGVDGVDESATEGRRSDVRVRLGQSTWVPIGMEPLPVGVAIPMKIGIPRHQATNRDGFTFFIDACCECELKLYSPLATDYVRDVIIRAAQDAANNEMLQGHWRYGSMIRAVGWDNNDFADRVKERMIAAARSTGNSSLAVHYIRYSVSATELDPVATLASATLQSNDPALQLVTAAFVEIFRKINLLGGRVRQVDEKAEAASEVVYKFSKVYGDQRPGAPRLHGWIHALFHAMVLVACSLSIGLFLYATFFPEEWKAYQDGIIQDWARSFQYHASGGMFGETMVQKHQRELAETQRIKDEMDILKKKEEEHKEAEEAKLKKREAEAARWQAEALAEQNMTPWERVLYRANVGDRRFPSYRRPRTFTPACSYRGLG